MAPRLERTSPRLPIGFAHRGARAECRDNTVAAFARALELGAEALESDVWLTADGVAVLDHDGQVRRGLRRVPIRTVARSELPGHIPSLADLYQHFGTDFELSLDVKDAAAAAASVAQADAVGAAGRLWLCGSGGGLASWRRLSGAVRLVASLSASQVPGEGAAALLVAAGIDAVNLRWPVWSPSQVDTVHAAGLLAFAWDAQRPGTITSLLGIGIDAVYSDHVAMMTGAIDAWRARR